MFLRASSVALRLNRKWLKELNCMDSSAAEGVFRKGFCTRSETTRRQWSATALTPKLQNIFSLSALTSSSPPLLADSLISHLERRGQKYNIMNLLPLPRARCLITIGYHGSRLAEWVITVISIRGARRRAHLGDGEVSVCISNGTQCSPRSHLHE